MRVYLIVDGATLKVTLSTARPVPYLASRVRRPRSRFAEKRGRRLAQTEMAFAVEIVVPGLWGTVSEHNPPEINLPTPIDLGITSVPVVSSRADG